MYTFCWKFVDIYRKSIYILHDVIHILEALYIYYKLYVYGKHAFRSTIYNEESQLHFK